MTGRPGRAHLLDELVDLRDAGLRHERRALLVVAQHAEQPAHLGERLAAGRRHGLHRRRRLLGRALGREDRAVGERDHDRQVVRDDVVHLARDARALGRRGDQALLVALELESRGAILERGEQRPAVADARSEHAGRDRERRQPDELAEAAVRGRREDGAELEHGRGQRWSSQRDSFAATV